MESGSRKLQPNPRQRANWLSILFFAWTIPVFKRTHGKVLDSSDVNEPLKADQSQVLGNRLERKWREECDKKSKPSLLKAILKTFWPEYLLIGILNFIFDVVTPLIVPFLLKNLLEYFRQDSDMTQHDALTYGTAIFVMTVLPGIASSHSLFEVFCTGQKVRVGVCSLIYHKSLRLSQTALNDTAPGKLVNLLSNDVSRFDTVTYTVHALWTAPLMTTVAAFILWKETGWPGILGLLVLLSVIPLQSYTGKLSSIIRFKIALRTDERVRFMDEIISGVQVIKMYAWEKPFAQLIAATRRFEMKEILKSGYIRGIFMTLNLFTIRMAMFATVLGIILQHDTEKIRVSKIFMVSYLLMGVSNATGRLFVRAIAETGETLVAIKRLQMFLEYEEKDERKDCDKPSNSVPSKAQNISISMTNVSAGWCKSKGQSETAKWKKNVNSYKDHTKQDDVDAKPFKLEELNLEIPKGKLVFVIGSVGAGKSTLIQVLLNELPLICGEMGVEGTISYACQESWIFASTVRQNITFGQPMNKSRYNKVIECTALKTDFAQLSDGDMTMVGENGTGLSGGQRARINLARAVYKDADIYLIDDPLSAVDTHVQSHLFNNCIGPNGFLARQNATRILVTHQVHFLKEADWIIVLKDGKIEAQGIYDDILESGIDIASMAKQKDENTDDNVSDLNKTIKSHRSHAPSMSAHEKSFSSTKENDDSVEESQLLNELEMSSQEQDNGSVLLKYLKSAKQPCVLAFLIISILLSQILVSLADMWISYWIKLEESRILHEPKVVNVTLNLTSFNFTFDALSTTMCIYICTTIVASLFVIASIKSIVFYKFSASASQNLHDSMFNGLITTTMRFFDTNPSGRILNRFSKDMGSVDEALPKAFRDAIQINLLAIGSILVTIITNVKFSIVILVMVVLFWAVRKVYLKSSTNIKRLEGKTKSPVFSHISATLSGLPTIRAFNAEQLLQQEFDDHQDLNTGAYFMFLSMYLKLRGFTIPSNQSQVKIETEIYPPNLGTSSGFGMTLDLMIYVFIGCVIYAFILMNEGVTGDRVGLAITQSLSLISVLQWGVRQSAEVTNLLTSVERILEYSQLEAEKQPEIPKKVPADWPSKGKIEFNDIFYRYSDDSEAVLRGLSFSVKPGEKIAVVGRTGAGKSSLIGSIFRLAIVEGGIVVDDIDTSSIDLNVLRSRISIIPQEPTLFSGTLRRNLDPFEEYNDDEIWSALEDVGMKDIVSEGKGLQMTVLARGQNFSTGQRQILCLARAILRKNRIIILDEATANVDQITDQMIQETIRRKFDNCTVIVVAHRLNTIIDSDRVLVMDAGRAVEFDKPHSLLQNENGVFYGMVKALGSQEFKRLSDIAQKAAKCAKTTE